MTQDSGLEPASPRDLHPVVAHFTDVIVDRAPPVQRRPRQIPAKAPTEVVSPALVEPQTSHSALLDQPAEASAHSGEQATTVHEDWFAGGTLAPLERETQPDTSAQESENDRQLVVAAAVTIGGTIALGVSLGALFASLS